MSFLGGANKSNFIPGGNSSPGKGGNSLPKGKGNGSWVGGRQTPRREASTKRSRAAKTKKSRSRVSGGNTSRSGNNSYSPQNSFNRTTPRSRGYSFTSSNGRGGSNLFSGGRARTPHNTPPRLNGTNYSINTRGTALTKGLGGAAIVKASPVGLGGILAKYGPLGLAAWLFAKIISSDVVDGTVPDHLRDVGEKQKVGKNKEWNDWTGVSGKQYRFKVRRRSSPTDEWEEETFGLGQKVFAPYSNMTFYFDNNISGYRQYGFPSLKAGGGASGKSGWFYFQVDASSQYGTPIDTITKRQIGSTKFNLEGDIEFLGLIPYDDEELYDPKRIEKNESKSTTNHSNIPTPERATTDNPPPSPIRPPFPSDRTANPTPSRGFEKPVEKSPVVKKAASQAPKGSVESDTSNSTNTSSNKTPTFQRARVEAPSETPEPLPKPTPEPEETLEEQQNEDTNQEAEQEPEYISERHVRLADGTRAIIRTRIAGSDSKTEREETIRTSAIPSAKNKNTPNPVKTGNSPPEPDKGGEATTTTSTPAKQTPSKGGSVKNKVDNLPTKEQIAIAVGGLDIIQQIAKKAGSASPVCLAPTLQPSLDRNNTTTAAAQVAILGQGQVIRNAITTVNNVLTHPTYGLSAIQSFAKRAWKVSGADKALNVVGTIASLHNAAMLSQNAIESLGDVIDQGASFFNIKDAEGEPLSISGAIGGFIRSKLTAIFGASNLNTASEIWLKLNRIHQSVGSVVCSIQGTKNALLEADEITGGHIAEIGNALQEQGLIEDDTYDWMNPEPDYRQPFKGILGRIDAIEETIDKVSNVVNTGLEIQENASEIVTNSQELIDATNDFLEVKKEKEVTNQSDSESPDIGRIDLLRDEPREAE